MSRRWMVVVGVLVVAVAGGAYLLGRGGGSSQKAAVDDPLAEALAFAPAAAPVVVQFDVERGSAQGDALRDLARTFPAARFAADGVRQSVRALGLDADEDLPSILGGPMVVSGPASAATALRASISGLALDLPAIVEAGATAAVVGRSADDVSAVLRRAAEDGRLRKLATGPARGVDGYALPDGGGVLGRRDGDVVLGGDVAAVKRAFAIKDAKGGLTRATFDARLGPLAHVPALIRATAAPRALISAKAQGVPWVDALRAGALAVAIEKPGVRLRIHLATDATKLADADLPIAPGPQAPQPAPGARPIDLALRDPAQTIRTLDAARNQLDLPFLDPIENALATLDSVKGPLETFGRIDVDDLIGRLTGTMTVTPEAADNAVAIRAEMTDGDALRTALDRLAAVPDVALQLAGVDLDVDRKGESYIITDKGKAIVKLAVLDRTLVVTNDLAASLTAIASRKPQPAAKSQDGGALSLHLDGLALQDQLVARLHLPDLARLVLGGFGDVDATARAERGGVDLDATLTLND